MRMSMLFLVGSLALFPKTSLAADLSKDESRVVMQNFANCMAKTYARDAKAFVELDPATVAPKDQLRLLHSECMPISTSKPLTPMPVTLSMQASTTHFRYAIAEALLLRLYHRSAPVFAMTSPRLSHPAISAGSSAPVSEAEARLSSFGECVVRSAPSEAWALLKTDVAGKGEKDAFAALTPTLARCLALDRSVKFGKFNLRGVIALNYYRLVNARPAAVQERG